MTDFLERLRDGHDGHGWSCQHDDEFELIGEAIATIERLRTQLVKTQQINRVLRNLADQLELEPEVDL